MSPRELAREFEAAHLRREDDYNRDVWLAWNVVRVDMLSHVSPERRQLPKIQTLLLGYQPRVETRESHRAQQLGLMKDLAERYGLRLRTKES